MDFLDEDRSLELFLSYAFKENDSSIEFEEVSQKVVNYVQGHPLALKHLGRFLYGKTVDHWVNELDKLKVYPNEKIQRVLRLSYDGLDLHQKNIFLDIACLFVGENRGFVASVLDGCNFYAVTNMQVLVDKSLITISSNNSLQMHDLIQAMAREIVCEESIRTGKHRRLWSSSEVYNALSEKKVPITEAEAVEVVVLSLEKFSQTVHIDANDFAHMKKLRILKIYQEEKVSEQKLELKGHNVIFSGNLYNLSNKLSLFYWHGCPFECLPSDFYPENIVAIDLSYSNIKHIWTTPKCFKRLKVMKLRYCCNLTTTPDFSEITILEELNLEGCVNLVNIHPSIGMLRRLVVLNLAGCLKVDQHPSFVSSTSITAPFGLRSKQHPQRSISLAGLHMLKSLNFSYCNLVQVPDGIGGLSCLKKLNLSGNNFSSLPGSLSQLSSLNWLDVNGCKKLEVLPELPHSLDYLFARDCTSLCSITGSNPIMSKRLTLLNNCPKLFKVSISETQCLDSSVTSQGSRLSSFLRYARIQNKCGLFRLPGSSIQNMDMFYEGNSIPNWFTNKSLGNHVKVELPSDWSFSKLRGYGICAVFKRKKPSIDFGYIVNNFDGASLGNCWPYYGGYFEDKPIRIDESDMIWLHYTTIEIWKLKEAKKFVTFCIDENEGIEVKEMGVRLVWDEDLDQEEVDLSMFQDIPTLSQHGGA